MFQDLLNKLSSPNTLLELVDAAKRGHYVHD